MVEGVPFGAARAIFHNPRLRSTTGFLLAVAIVAVGAGSTPAVAHPATASASTSQQIPGPVERVLGEEARARPDGLYAVPVPGEGTELTHGPDRVAAVNATAPLLLEPGGPTRPPVCATGHYQHVLYVRTPASNVGYAAARPQIGGSVRRMNALLNEESFHTGGGSADYKVRCRSDGVMRIGKVVAPAHDFGSVISAAAAAGYDDPKAKYLMYIAGNDPNFCGLSSIDQDDRLVEDNANNTGGDYSAVYRNCWSRGAAMHELGHAQGAVQPSAPFSTGSGLHCWQSWDVMCYSPDGGDVHQEGVEEFCSARLRFDCGADTYFDAAPELGEYLSDHWNLGSRLNRYIAFGDRGSIQPPEARIEAACTGQTCRVRDRSVDTDGEIVSRVWSFGDGTHSSAAATEHTYGSTGPVRIALTVTDSDGAPDTITKEVELSAP
jgi:hypothetical protein